MKRREAASHLRHRSWPDGQSRAIAYQANPRFEIVDLANRSAVWLPEVLRGYPMVKSLEEGLALKPDIVSVNTYTGSHADYAVAAIEAGAHVFVEKPLPAGVEEARRVVETAKRTGRKLVIGYILRHHPSWIEFIRLARMRGEPGLQQLCDLEQAFGLRAIKENLDLTRHWSDAVRSLEILLAAHRSMRERRAVDF